MITYLKGDATAPQIKGNKFILQVCNDIGAYGAGFSGALSHKWNIVKEEYQNIPKEKRIVGNYQIIKVEDDILVANMIGQNGTGFNEYNVPPVNYGAIEVMLKKIFKLAKENKATVCMPKIGAGLAGGSWEIIELVILRALRETDVDVYVYEFE